MGKPKLKSALDEHKGRNFKLEKQRKKEKAARKRKENNQPLKEDTGDEDVDVEVDEDEDGGVQLDNAVDVEVNGKAKKGKKSSLKAAPAVKEPEWETDESEGEDDEDDMPDRLALDLARLEDSDSEGSDDDDAQDEDEEENEDDIPLSDIESLASEDRGDVIPHQRLTINNTAALTAALKRIQLPYSKLTFSEYQSMTTDEAVEIPDVEDDLNRELAFYKQSLSAVKDARERLKKEGQPFSRPTDYFAEMVKSDEHMGKIKAKLIDTAAGKKAAAEARKQRDLKKFGKQVQVAKQQERAKDKRDTMDKINVLKRKRQGADVTNTNEEDLFDVELDKAAKTSDRRKSDGNPHGKRQKKDAKYGFGGKKRHAKSNDAVSTNDDRDYSVKKMKGKPGGAAELKPGHRIQRRSRSLFQVMAKNPRADLAYMEVKYYNHRLYPRLRLSMEDELFVEYAPQSSSTPNPPSRSAPLESAKPTDDFTVPSTSKSTIFYLLVITPHTDSFAIHGPTTTFAALMPKVLDVVSNSPAAIEKLDNLKADNEDFDASGFSTFVVDGQRNTHTILRIVREANAPVRRILPAPVYTVTAHGPLLHNLGSSLRTVSSGKPLGMATTSGLIGSFVDAATADKAATRAMDQMIKDEKGVHKTMTRESGKRRVIMLAMNARAAWEARVLYDDRELGWARAVVGKKK
ncbi:eukaryotic rRNA processing protein EBP2-domain-containing protein [Massariosphaeria phaeospora]|uniref:Eukaryotic rRNA processing protein EBP2-domain-containing protein n=1 Tax=Massariosphaeria phaeospora TaxID=100035 RepID=A0A7C8MS89_9PLEO|nr:eukaryotic rRNA processing protein EBP2-domain-containing protein [Massariosphaeria phaeospora]